MTILTHFHLFCGIGGGAMGFQQASPRIPGVQGQHGRFECLGGIDSDPAAIRDFSRLTGTQGTVLDLFDHDQYLCTKFRRRRIYCAWDRLRDERRFFEGVDRLERSGIPPRHLRAYMLIGHDPEETIESRLYRFNRMVGRGIEPYPMPIDRTRKDLVAFSRWAVTGLYRAVPWEEYRW